MENIKIGLITENKDYGKALGLALVDVYRNFTVTLFQSVPLHNELEKMDLVLVDSTIDIKIRGKFILMAEKQSQICKDYDENIFKLYKYSNVKNLAGELLFIYTSLTGRKAIPVRNTNAKIVVFSSVEGGVGCTSTAIAFAQEMSRYHGKKVIYISLEELESTMEYVEKGATAKSISEYLYYLFNSKDDQKYPFIESFTVSDRHRVDSFMPSPGRNLLNSLSKEEMQFFVSAVLDTGGYDVMVIDAGNNLGKSVTTCYEMANNICLVTKYEEISYKEERFLDYFIFFKGEKFLERMGRVVNFSKEISGKGYDGILSTVCYLPDEPDSFVVCESVKEIKADGGFGKGINHLTNSIIKNVIRSNLT